ncbi:3-hydroxylacyl-ACP dehydratase [Azospirillum thermophilum]|uniref:3-hydroxylacyl-ACP dehydratase n=1 Tax=Azospirillum thermophilum TaxID=2202148 RepID=A0A2S2CP77_9PROT|nr:3-hydroxylacyl-ACP dehydratase [Azospirillum thermophilum]AWK86268.1 3-hydroxylacyl-ACP dehydratase [Azospirillum thermophilum]
MEALLPHARPMILLDEVVGRDEARLVAALTVRARAPFFEPGRGMAAHVAIEWMAQACGAFVGAEALESGGVVRLGLLLGTRSFSSSISWFPEGARVEVSATLDYRDGEMGVFDCTATLRGPEVDGPEGDGQEAASAQLTVYQPADAGALLASQGVKITS